MASTDRTAGQYEAELEKLRRQVAELKAKGADLRKVEQELRDANMRLSDALAELKYTHQQIIQHERLSALGQMASGIAHDFNNALMPILGYSEILLTGIGKKQDSKETADILMDIHSAAKGATEIVRRLRDFYRPADDHEHVLVNLIEIIEAALSLTQPKWKEELKATGISIQIKRELEEIPPIKGSGSQLREVLTNIILNSLDAMPDGGTITVRTRAHRRWVIVEIQDTGTGMTDEARHRCFEPFFSTKGNHGTGMGLALAYGIIRRHGGAIDVQSEPDRGTTFTIRLPQQISVMEEDKTETRSMQVPPLHILVIDDDLWSHDLLARYLRAQKHTVETAETGSDGLKKFQNARFDLVITDRAMPDMSGDQVAAKIKGINPKTPVILATGFGEIMKDKGEVPLGVDVVVGKPVTELEVRRAVAEALAQNSDDTQ